MIEFQISFLNVVAIFYLNRFNYVYSIKSICRGLLYLFRCLSGANNSPILMDTKIERAH